MGYTRNSWGILSLFMGYTLVIHGVYSHYSWDILLSYMGYTLDCVCAAGWYLLHLLTQSSLPVWVRDGGLITYIGCFMGLCQVWITSRINHDKYRLAKSRGNPCHIDWLSLWRIHGSGFFAERVGNALLMAKCSTVVTPLLTKWRYRSTAKAIYITYRWISARKM